MRSVDDVVTAATLIVAPTSVKVKVKVRVRVRVIVPVPVPVPVPVIVPVPVNVIVLIFFWGKTWNSPGNCLLLPPLTQVPVPVF